LISILPSLIATHAILIGIRNLPAGANTFTLHHILEYAAENYGFGFQSLKQNIRSSLYRRNDFFMQAEEILLTLQSALLKMKPDKEIVLLAVEGDGQLLQHAHRSLQRDRDVIDSASSQLAVSDDDFLELSSGDDEDAESDLAASSGKRAKN
jgi:hypothetical protein